MFYLSYINVIRISNPCKNTRHRILFQHRDFAFINMDRLSILRTSLNKPSLINIKLPYQDAKSIYQPNHSLLITSIRSKINFSHTTPKRIRFSTLHSFEIENQGFINIRPLVLIHTRWFQSSQNINIDTQITVKILINFFTDEALLHLHPKSFQDMKEPNYTIEQSTKLFIRNLSFDSKPFKRLILNPITTFDSIRKIIWSKWQNFILK